MGSSGAAYGISDYRKGKEVRPGRRLRVDRLEEAAIERLKGHLLTDAKLDQMAERGADRL